MTLEQLNQKARLVEANWCAAWATLGGVRAEPATIVTDTADYLRIHTPGEPEALLNIVMRYTSAEAITQAEIERVIAPYRQHRLPFQWWLTRGTEPPALRKRLDAMGMETWGGAKMMCLSLDEWSPSYPPAPVSVSLRRALNEDDAQAALSIMCAVFALPREPMARWTTMNASFDLWLATLGARPVAAMASLLDGDTFGIYHLATSHGARRRGVAGNLLRTALVEARTRGARWATLTATPEAEGVYEALGYRACGLLEQWMPGPRLARALSGSASGAFDTYWE